MKREIVEVVRNEKVGENIFLMELKGDFSAIKIQENLWNWSFRIIILEDHFRYVEFIKIG